MQTLTLVCCSSPSTCAKSTGRPWKQLFGADRRQEPSKMDHLRTPKLDFSSSLAPIQPNLSRLRSTITNHPQEVVELDETCSADGGAKRKIELKKSISILLHRGGNGKMQHLFFYNLYSPNLPKKNLRKFCSNFFFFSRGKKDRFQPTSISFQTSKKLHH